ncbi:hypothetical protein [Gemmatimonas sp.]|uniref:hypothetical protein n=1 Tax=Gemmatimonas sp. TaxID=1962908 RepID=UPI0035629AFA
MLLVVALIAALTPAWYAQLLGGNPSSADTTLGSLTAATIQAALVAAIAYATVRYASLTAALLDESACQRQISQQQLEAARDQVAASLQQVDTSEQELLVASALSVIVRRARPPLEVLGLF